MRPAPDTLLNPPRTLWERAFVARGLAPVGSRSGPKNGTAAQSNGGKPPRHKSLAPTKKRPQDHLNQTTKTIGTPS
ncbi:hypothetical protein F7R14_07330 [Pseudomonas lini]|uniref:Uncharacterized protein n=1 Tax=Pseudomonas lini TaxID=163011 RepID=A0A7V7P5J1_9PSED|nr:hypothetical protein F7R14_07330 [Pseudomonas lini]MDT9677571.1 hypothetical protein [Pseudomonas sp. JV414]